MKCHGEILAKVNHLANMSNMDNLFKKKKKKGLQIHRKFMSG